MAYTKFDNVAAYVTKWGPDINLASTRGRNPRYEWWDAVQFFRAVASRDDPTIKKDASGLWTNQYLANGDELVNIDANDIYERFISLQRKKMSATLELNYALPKAWLVLKSRPNDEVHVWAYSAGNFKDV